MNNCKIVKLRKYINLIFSIDQAEIKSRLTNLLYLENLLHLSIHNNTR